MNVLSTMPHSGWPAGKARNVYHVGTIGDAVGNGELVLESPAGGDH